MRAPKRKREKPRTVCKAVPAGVILEELAQRVTYAGSPEHKAYPSPAGSPKLRADASKCDPSFKGKVQEIEHCLRDGIRNGRVGGPWESIFPRYVWNFLHGMCYEARLVNSESGAYKGYPVSLEELPKGLSGNDA